MAMMCEMCGKKPVFGNRISHTGAERRFDHVAVNGSDPATRATPPFRGLCDGVAEEFGGEAPEVRLRQFALDEVQVVTLNMSDAREAECVSIGEQASVAWVSREALAALEDEAINLSGHWSAL